jgi:anhydro-N-acetylmuramic acid kinase
MKVLGIMSGTSIDGVDYALCEVSARAVELRKLWSREFPKKLQQRLHAAAANECGAHELAQLHHDLGRLFAEQARQLVARPELVGMHGQTVFHQPATRPTCPRRLTGSARIPGETPGARWARSPATLQLGEPAYLAEALRVPVVSNFRAADMAAGGQGAPLATLFHKIVFARRGQHVCVNNLGGISNVTSLDWRSGKEPRVMAFDTGPANVLLDLAMREFTNGRLTFDRDGRWAERGTINMKLLLRWLEHPFFKLRPPKSTGRELFGEAFWRAELPHMRKLKMSQFDVLATLTEFTAYSMVLNYALHLRSVPGSVVLCGGGAKNPALFAAIISALDGWKAGIKLWTSEDFGWPSSAIEPAAFALLAFYRWKNLPGNIPATTGARRRSVLGQVQAV